MINYKETESFNPSSFQQNISKCEENLLVMDFDRD